MADKAAVASPVPPRKPRADAARNHALLLETAKNVFAQKGANASLDEIAKAAGVGIGTLYRHFPTRDALIEQVYRKETVQLAEAAETLLATHTPAEALRQWLLLYIDYFTTKQIMAQAISTLAGGTATLYAISSTLLTTTVTTLARKAEESGEIKLAVPPLDLVRAVSGVGSFNTGPGWEENARRLVDVLIEGMRVKR